MFPIAYHPVYRHPVPEGHRFPMDKYELLPLQLLREGIVSETDFFSPAPVALEAVYAVHQQAYIDDFLQGRLSTQAARRIGFEQSPLLVERELRLTQGTLSGALRALDTGIAFNIAGGTHHACYDYGEGFCMINDQAVAAQYLLDHTTIRKVLIIDLDVHQGNGTANIFRHETRVFTFSMHGANNYPFRKEQSDLDIGLPDGTTDSDYLHLLQQTLPRLIDKVQPGFIFYQAGVDILDTDKMGRMACTLSGCRQRDELVLATAQRHGIPLQCSMGGGYAPDIRTIIEAHANTYRVAKALY
ncbi:histone deacetylase family protein [Taibaiella chishuiensis]|uniref:Acetoin utilization deacetylase AcuC-like enzyme n=1 Tax=Taibaiella chishuiensis TaxID=1434707 RepID=A0A2P8CVB2_9BACT|nr:histone deacetylase [Taibaiella chishuiensis]PSK88892.1 acetoin utilization deacetylase AcuC-like enzyme [Taibaiella chishuiensis]